jgi:predicted dehydrogenase
MDSRRNFLGKVASGLGTLAAVPARVWGAHDRIRVGFIGFGDRATDLLSHVRACPNTEAAAFCDVFTKQVDRARTLAPGASVYGDYRRLLSDSSIDAVVIATPPHLHAEHFCAALDAGKHVYQEKTMAFDVHHARQMRAAFEHDGSRHVVQIGHQACSSGHMHDAQMFLSEPGRVGKITTVAMRMFRNTPRGKAQWSRTARITPDVNASNIAWNAFLGDAPPREFDANRYMNWRLFWDYSGGNVFEHMSHQLAFWYRALDLEIPRTATSAGGVLLWKDGREVPDTMNVSLQQPEDVLIHWASCFGNSYPGVGEDVLGDHGTISRDTQVRYVPQKINRPDGNEMTGRATHLPHAHMQNFVDSIRGDASPNCPFEIGWRVSIAARMAVESYRLGRTVRWDPTTEEIV